MELPQFTAVVVAVLLATLIMEQVERAVAEEGPAATVTILLPVALI